MINILLTAEGFENMPKHLAFPMRAEGVQLTRDQTNQVSCFRIDYVSSGFEWLDDCLRQIVLPEKHFEVRIVQQLNLLAFVLERMTMHSLSEMEGSFCDGLSMEDLINRAYYYADYAAFPDVVPVEQFRNYHLGGEYSLLCKEERGRYPVPRMTGGALFSRIFSAAEEGGDLQYVKPILDYTLPSETGIITNYEFDFVPQICFGGSEGIYIDCYLHGSFDDTDNQWLNIGTIKTLRTDVEACKLMGALCGSLLYHESAFVNAHLNLFTPEKELKKNASWKGERALCQSIGLLDKLDACVEELLRAAGEQGKSSVTVRFSRLSQVLGWELTPDNKAAVKAIRKKLLHSLEVMRVKTEADLFKMEVRPEMVAESLLKHTVDWVMESAEAEPEKHTQISFAELTRRSGCEVNGGSVGFLRICQMLGDRAGFESAIPEGDTVVVSLRQSL